MGVGKSTVGKNLATKLSYSFIDIDKIIETKNHLTLTINKGETSPTAALPATVLNAQNIDVSVNRKWGLVKIFINFDLIRLNILNKKKLVVIYLV